MLKNIQPIPQDRVLADSYGPSRRGRARARANTSEAGHSKAAQQGRSDPSPSRRATLTRKPPRSHSRSRAARRKPSPNGPKLDEQGRMYWNLKVSRQEITHLGVKYQNKLFYSNGKSNLEHPPRRFDNDPSKTLGEPVKAGDIWIHCAEQVNEMTGREMTPEYEIWVHFGGSRGWLETTSEEYCMHPTPGLEWWRLHVNKNCVPHWALMKNGKAKMHKSFDEKLKQSGKGATDRMVGVSTAMEVDEDLVGYTGPTTRSRSRERSLSLGAHPGRPRTTTPEAAPPSVPQWDLLEGPGYDALDDADDWAAYDDAMDVEDYEDGHMGMTTRSRSRSRSFGASIPREASVDASVRSRRSASFGHYYDETPSSLPTLSQRKRSWEGPNVSVEPSGNTAMYYENEDENDYLSNGMVTRSRSRSRSIGAPIASRQLSVAPSIRSVSQGRSVAMEEVIPFPRSRSASSRRPSFTSRRSASSCDCEVIQPTRSPTPEAPAPAPAPPSTPQRKRLMEAVVRNMILNPKIEVPPSTGEFSGECNAMSLFAVHALIRRHSSLPRPPVDGESSQRPSKRRKLSRNASGPTFS